MTRFCLLDQKRCWRQYYWIHMKSEGLEFKPAYQDFSSVAFSFQANDSFIHWSNLSQSLHWFVLPRSTRWLVGHMRMPHNGKKILLVFRFITQLVNFAKDIESTRFFYSIFRGGGGDEIAWVQVDVGLCKPWRTAAATPGAKKKT